MKWTRNDSRGILTERERRCLEAERHLDRHTAHVVGLKTDKAIIDDLPLLLRKPLSLNRGDYHDETTIPILEAYFKSLVAVLYRFHEYRLMKIRHKKGLKLKVASREVWKAINKTLKEVKNEVPIRINEQKEKERQWVKDHIRQP
jgi:hypothetical protein